ncbi:MAG: alpha-mannosidase, partial [Anaerolineae bacterium]|nr:alpha-mannosidase [Anaerolineae bacterium]
MNQPTLHMIGNGHIDPVWLWQWQEGFQEVLATFRSALDRMNEYPDFHFTASSAAFYSWVERIDPAMFAEIQARVAEGRWELAGGWWIEPDCNVPGGESFVRQGLYGQRYFKEKFGVTARVGYAIDSFGHHAVLPQILKKSGLDFYVFMRPGPHEKDMPGRISWWESEDSSRVLTFRIPFSYCVWGDNLEPHIRRCAAEMQPPIDELMCFYGVGNHGGGPTVDNIAGIQRLNTEENLPHLAFSTTAAFFDNTVAKDWPLPIVHDELQHHASGCYAAHSGIKRWNRLAENTLMRAEKWSAVAAQVTGLPYPKAALTQAWKDTLFNQFHDIMAGTSLEEAYEDAHNLYGEAVTLAGRAMNDAAQSLAWQMAIPHEDAGTPGVRPIVVFNANAWPSRVPVELEVGQIPESIALTHDAG